MKRKIPPEAFAFYLGLGVGRSYSAVAERYNVTKRAVAFKAEKERWQERLEQEERKASTKAEKEAAESIESVNEKHLKVLRFIQARSIEALKEMKIETAMDAVKAFALALDKERMIRGPGDQAASRIEEITRQEIRSLLITTRASPDDPNNY